MFKKDYTVTMTYEDTTSIITISEIIRIEYVKNTYLILYYKNGFTSKIECDSNHPEALEKIYNKIRTLFYKYNRY